MTEASRLAFRRAVRLGRQLEFDDELGVALGLFGQPQISGSQVFIPAADRQIAFRFGSREKLQGLGAVSVPRGHGTPMLFYARHTRAMQGVGNRSGNTGSFSMISGRCRGGDGRNSAKRTYCEQRTNSVHCLPSVDSGGAAGAALSGGRIPAIRSSTMSQPALRVVEGSSMDKSKALSAALSQIERQFGKGSVMKLGKNDKAMDIEAISSGSLGLDIALGIGGLPRGRVVEIYGPESSGKTTLALHTIAEAQKKGGICAFVDAEHALDPIYARKLGVNVD